MQKPKTKILVIDDNDFARELLLDRLRSEGYEMSAAATGPEGLALAERVLPDLVLLDVMMPDMDGFEVCRRLREHPVLGEVPIIMITALEDSESRVKGLDAGADDFVSKSYEPTELRARVRTISRLNRYRLLLAERTKFQWVVDEADEGFLLVDSRDEILYANGRAEEMLGLEDAEGRSFLEIATSGFRCEPWELWAEWPDLGSAPLFLLRPETSDRGAYWLRVDQLRLPTEDGDQRLIRIRDETRQMELGRGMWKFRSLVSHKLEAGLTMILGSLELLTEDAARYSESEIRQVADLALRSGQRLRRQVQDIVDSLGKPDATVGSDAVPLSELEGLTRELATTAGVKPFAWTAEAEIPVGRLPLSHLATELVLREVLENLKRYGASERSPAAEARVSFEGEGPANREIVLAVRSDAGTVPAEELSRLWIPYYLRSEDDAGRAAGGLGLSMAGSLVWGAGGNCRVEDLEGGGVEVRITLPVLPGRVTVRE